MKFDMRIKNIKNMQSNDYIFKICSHVNFFSGNYSQLQTSMLLNFVYYELVYVLKCTLSTIWGSLLQRAKVISFEVERLNFVEISILKFLDERDQEMTKKIAF